MTNIITFHDTPLSIVDHNGQKWLTGSEIARALGYEKPDAATQIFHAHRTEFNGDTSVTLRLRVRGKSCRVRIFNRRGAHLIAMFAKTERAKEFRKWVLDVLDGHAKASALPAQPQLALPAPPATPKAALDALGDVERGLNNLRVLHAMTEGTLDAFWRKVWDDAFAEVIAARHLAVVALTPKGSQQLSIR